MVIRVFDTLLHIFFSHVRYGRCVAINQNHEFVLFILLVRTLSSPKNPFLIVKGIFLSGWPFMWMYLTLHGSESSDHQYLFEHRVYLWQIMQLELRESGTTS